MMLYPTGSVQKDFFFTPAFDSTLLLFFISPILIFFQLVLFSVGGEEGGGEEGHICPHSLFSSFIVKVFYFITYFAQFLFSVFLESFMVVS